MTPEDLETLVMNLSDPPDPYLETLRYQYRDDTGTRTQYYNFLFWLVLFRQPKLVVELGVEFGLASAYMASAARKYGGHVVGVDHNIMGGDLKLYQLPAGQINKMYGNYHFIHADTLSIPTTLRIKDFVEKYGPIGVLFQDSSHHYGPSVQEWKRYSPMLDDGAIWVCDDITTSFYEHGVDPPGKGMVQYFEELPGTKRLFPDILHKGNTMGVVLL